jgi:hypothetical protein
MSRRFLDDVRADINAQIIANGAGLVTANILRPLMIDTIDSTIDDEAVIGSNTLVPALAVNDVTWTPLPADIEVGGDAQFLTVDLINDQIISAPTAGYTYNATGLASLSGATNRVFEMAILQSGVPVGYIGNISTGGNARPVSAQAFRLSLSTPISSNFQLGIRSVTNANDVIDVVSSALTLTVKPTNNP